jgi:hypothetical protein
MLQTIAETGGGLSAASAIHCNVFSLGIQIPALFWTSIELTSR